MFINQIETTPENRQVYGYKRDGNTVTAHRWKVFPLVDSLYLQEPVTDKYGQRYAHIVFLLDGVKIGLDVGMLNSWQIDEYSAEDVAERVGFRDLDSFSAHVRADMKKGGFVRDSWISFVRQFDVQFSDEMQACKADYLARLEKQQEERRAEMERREQQEREQRARELDEAIADAEKKILTGGRIENIEIAGKCLFLHLFDARGIDVPIRSRGWIAQKLTAVIKCGESVSVVMSTKRKGEKVSSGFSAAWYALVRALKNEESARIAS
jgi:hypothetical protein